MKPAFTTDSTKKIGKRVKKIKKKSKNKKDLTNIKSQHEKLSVICPICLQDLCNKSVLATKCGHVFCATCLKTTLERQSDCPKCRSKIKSSRGYHAIYLDTSSFCKNVLNLIDLIMCTSLPLGTFLKLVFVVLSFIASAKLFSMLY